jgi:aminoglycoside phosphotransferase (APT) family kinase protein
VTAGFDDLLLARVRAAAEQWSPNAVVQSLDPVTKGSSSLTYTARLHDVSARPVTAYVKVAPPGLPPVRNRDVLRQAAVLDVLHREGTVPTPRVLFRDAGAPPEVPPFFATESAEGSCLEPLVDDAVLPPAEELSARTADAAQTLAALHRVDPAPLRGPGAGPLAEPADLEFEVDRWARIFTTADAGIGTSSIGDAAQACAQRLRSTVPEPLGSVIVHGDFRLGNIVCAASGVRAILDWEIWSLTDPRIDVAWFLMTLSSRGLPSAIRDRAPGLLSPEEALAVYQRASGSELADLAWFGALSRFRAAAAMSLNIKHNRRRPNPNPRIESYTGTLPEFLSLATALIDSKV